MTPTPELSGNDGVDDARKLAELSHDDIDKPLKRQRNFIARQVIIRLPTSSTFHVIILNNIQACQACRAKKTRCDEDLPCSLCKTLGIECNYAERKPTKYVKATKSRQCQFHPLTPAIETRYR